MRIRYSCLELLFGFSDGFTVQRHFLKTCFDPPLMKTVILRTHERTKSYFFRTLTVAPSVGLSSKLATKPPKPIIVLSPLIM
jgi:hypothetical protein